MSKAPRGRGAAANVVAIEDAARDLARQKRRREDPPPTMPRKGFRDGKQTNEEIAPQKFASSPRNWTSNHLGLPSEEECPVEPLGIEGDVKHLIDSDGQLRSWTKSDFNQAGLADLFSAMPNYPKFYYPRHGKVKSVKDDDSGESKPVPPPIESFKADDVRDALFLACSRKGLWSPAEKLRGRGMWATRTEIVYHAGEELWVYDLEKKRMRSRPTGLYDGYFYPRFPALPAPWTHPVEADTNPAGDLIAMLRSPNWARPDIDPVLLLGWIGVAYLGGALDWRSAVLLLGDKGTGKSTLQDDFKALFGEALFHTADTSAAGIYQDMRTDSRPIAIDELEPNANSRKVQDVVTLMRDASSGAIGRRGTSEGAAKSFQMRSAFLFSAIINPLSQAQDLSRVAVLRLKPLPKDLPPRPTINADSCGRMLLAVLMREWPRFYATRDLYMQALKDGGHDARGQKTYGTLLAAADCLLGAELGDALKIHTAYTLEGQENSAGLQWWSEHLSADALPEIEDAQANWNNCLRTILNSQVDAWRGGHRATPGQCLADLEVGEVAMVEADQRYTRAQAMRDLAAAGLGIVHAEVLIQRIAGEQEIGLDVAGATLGLSKDDGWLLAVPSSHPQLKKLLRDTPWATGVWQDALRQCPIDGIMLTDKRINRVTIGGVQARCTLVVLSRYKRAVER